MTAACPSLLERGRRVTEGLPVLLKSGFVVLGVGLALDLAMHLLGAPDEVSAAHEHGRGSGAGFIHALVFVGMGLSIAGLLSSAFRRSGRHDHGSERSSASERSGDQASFEAPETPVATTEVQPARSYRFDPAVIEVVRGSSVTRTNEDDFPHDVPGLAGSNVVRDLPVGGSASIAFEETGTVYYECSIHPQQTRGKIEVQG